jgi:Uma2 family endonuclease
MAETTQYAVAFLPSGRSDYIASERMGFERYLALEYEQGLAEWVNGEVRLYMSASNSHQRIVDFLNRLLGVFVESRLLGIVRSAPYTMRAIPDGPGREPDLMFVAAEHRARMLDSHLSGPADLVIEVVSADSATRDRVEKFQEYQAAGIPEYWIIDSRPGNQRADFFQLVDGAYQVASLEPGGVYHSAVLAGFWLDANWLWADEPNAMAALAQITGVSFPAP